jgi:hypothetical protein
VGAKLPRVPLLAIAIGGGPNLIDPDREPSGSQLGIPRANRDAVRARRIGDQRDPLAPLLPQLVIEKCDG